MYVHDALMLYFYHSSFLSHSLYLNLKKFAQNVSRVTYTADADALNRVTIQICVW